MLDALKQWLAGFSPSQPLTQTPQELVAFLLIEVASADGEVDRKETLRIRQMIKEAYLLSTEKLDSLLERAEAQVKNSTSLYNVVQQINEHFSAEQKYELVRQLWQVALVDDKLDKYEEALIRHIAELIYVAHRDFIRAKLSITEEGLSPALQT